MDNGKGKACLFGVAGAADAAAAASLLSPCMVWCLLRLRLFVDAPGADAPGGGAADAPVADAFEAAAAGADACSPSGKGDKGGKRAERQPE